MSGLILPSRVTPTPDLIYISPKHDLHIHLMPKVAAGKERAMNTCLEVLLLLLVAALLLVTAPVWLPLALEIGLALSFLWVPLVLLLVVLWVIFHSR